MILPTKHISIQRSLIGLGSEVLSILNEPHNVSLLWNKSRKIKGIKTFEIFVATLDFLFMIGAIDFNDGLINKK